MDKPRKKIRVVGERRAELDLERFADALITFALHRLSEDASKPDRPDAQPDPGQEAS
ncbi:hypothetical protein Lesp02_28300 [Lentzea sp. NBRC 105346]|nr:hypothetical protein Lesp02_28300 [Lentzea sp. NBRC 105346]